MNDTGIHLWSGPGELALHQVLLHEILGARSRFAAPNGKPSVKAGGLGLAGWPPDRLDVTFEPPINLKTSVPEREFVASPATEVDLR